MESTYQSIAGLLAITVALQLGLDPLQTLDRIEHRALEINRVDLADRGEILFCQLENFLRRHALGHGQLVERMRRDRGHAGFRQMLDDQVIETRVERREQQHSRRRVNAQRRHAGVERGGEWNRTAPLSSAS